MHEFVTSLDILENKFHFVFTCTYALQMRVENDILVRFFINLLIYAHKTIENM